jgi:hypothetical protein
MAEFALPVSKQSKAWKKSHKRGNAFPMGTRRQAGSARGFAIMMANKGQLTRGELGTIVKRTEKAGLKPARITGKKGSYKLATTERKKSNMATKRRGKKKTTRRVRRPKSFRGTRKGQVRKTARRAYQPKRRARRGARRNPKGILQTPGAQYGLAAVAGAAAATFLTDMASQPGSPASRLEFNLGQFRVPAAVTGAILTILGSRFLVRRAKTRQILTAAAAGMLAPVAINQTQMLYAKQVAGAADMRRAALVSGTHRARSTGQGPQYGGGYRAVRAGPHRPQGVGNPANNYNSAAHFSGDLIPT